MSRIVRALPKNNDMLNGSLNNQYQFLDGTQPVAKYMKTCLVAITGVRINPNTPFEAPEMTEFMLRTHENDFAAGKWGKNWKEPSYYKFNYDNDVVELYSVAEVEMFKLYNKKFLDNGVLKEYDGTKDGTVYESVAVEVIEKEKPDKTVEFGRR